MKSFSTRLFTSPSYKPTEEIHLAIEYVNRTTKAFHVSKNIAEAFKLGEETKSIKRKEKKKGTINQSAFFTVPANSSIIKKVNLGKQPGLKPGRHILLFQPTAQHIRQAKSSKSKVAGSSLKIKSIRIHINVKSSKQGHAVFSEKNFTVSELLDHPGIPELMQPLMLSRRLPEGLAPPRICKVVGGSQEQQDTVRLAHEDGYILAVAALSNLGNNGHYETWFGFISDDRFRRVRDVFRHIVDNFRHETFVYDLTGTDCGETEIGHTNFGSRTIHFCNRFWRLPPRGRSSMAGRIVHEHSHASADTLDSAFSFDDCLDLAHNSPAQAVENGSNYQFFAEG